MLELGEDRDQTGGPLIVAAVGAVSASGTTLILPGQTAATQKKYRRLASAGSLAPGDLALCARVSGTYVILGKIVA